jgi:hypothetical protein
MSKLLPYIVELPFGSEKHRAALEYVRQRVTASRQRRTNREDRWSDAENLFTSYVKETETDSRRRSRRDSEGVPQYTTITIPYSYATLMTAHTYWTSVFLARDPIHQIQALGNEPESSERAVESVLQYNVITGRNLPAYYIWLLDQGKYGEGIMGMAWDVERTYIPQLVTKPATFAGIPIPGKTKQEWESREVLGYEGMRLFNVRPHDFLFDPAVTLREFQKGEFAGHDSFVSMTVLKDGEALGKFFNTMYVKSRKQSIRAQTQAQGSDTELPGSQLPQVNVGSGDTYGGCDLTEITIELVPREVGLAPRDYLEKWTFTIANDEIIVGCQPQGWFHNNFMYDVLEHEIEGYNVSKRGMMEMLRPLNVTLDWLFNTHFFNVRKVLNDEFIYDPSILLSKDVESPGPGKLIRVRPEAYGKDITKAFYQLQTQDVTQNHVRDAMMIIEMMQRLTGVNDTVMGMLNNSRRTATEVRSSSSFAVNRLKTQCEYYSAMGFSPHACRLIQVLQQMFAGKPEKYFRTVGNRAEITDRFVSVGPNDIAGSFDYVPVDGTMPVDRQAQAAVFTQMMQQMATIPPVAQGYDWVRLFGYAAELHGVRNLQRFRVNVVPDAQAQQQAQAGNIVPASNIIQNAAGISGNGPGQGAQ